MSIRSYHHQESLTWTISPSFAIRSAVALMAPFRSCSRPSYKQRSRNRNPRVIANDLIGCIPNLVHLKCHSGPHVGVLVIDAYSKGFAVQAHVPIASERSFRSSSHRCHSIKQDVCGIRALYPRPERQGFTAQQITNTKIATRSTLYKTHMCNNFTASRLRTSESA